MPLQILTENTINKIAAGEVVERPANAAKELIENSLDSGATAITIDIAGAGRALLRVTDNGCGMNRDELALSIQRHATSKISTFEDLGALGTFGFRGEALSSIAAVSKFTIRSRCSNTAEGWQITVTGGTLKESRNCAMAPGTTVEVKDLFYNTPARAKFLKSDTTEKHRLLRVVEELAIAWPNVAFSVNVDNKTTLRTTKTASVKERLLDVLGKGFLEGIVPVNATHPQACISGFVTAIEHSLASKDTQYLFVNKRPINLGRSFSHAIYQAYHQQLPIGRHPGIVLFIDTDPAQVDVNIHPTKREVRFACEREIYSLLSSAIAQALTRTPLIPLQGPAQAKTVAPASYQNNFVPYEQTKTLPEETLFLGPKLRETTAQYTDTTLNGLLVLGQAFNLYVLAQRGEELLLIDQHAAHERINYEAFRKDFEAKAIKVQPLLLPLNLELPASQAALILENQAMLACLGCEIEPFGKRTVRISAVPAILGTETQLRNLVASIIDALSTETQVSHDDKIEKVIRAACRASIKQRDRMTMEEMTRLINDLLKCDKPYTCPHGRPTMRSITKEELNRFFGRN
jgi:DNA mismatch repair protein MutL